MIEVLRKKSNGVATTLLVLLLALFLYINTPFILPFIIAGIFALGLNDFVTRNSLRWRTPRGLIITLVLFAGLFLFWAPLSLAAYRIISLVKIPDSLSTTQVSTQINSLKNLAVELVQKVSAIVGTDLTTPVREALDSIIQKTGELLLSFSSTALRSTPSFIFSGLIFTLFLVVLLNQAQHFKNFTIKYSPLDEKLTTILIEVLKTSCSVSLFSTFVIGVIQAGIIGLGSLVFSEGDFWLVMPVTFVLAFIPVIGAGPVGFTLALLAFIGGRTGSAIGMLIFSTVASTIDSFLKPMLIGGKDIKISPILGFTCVLGAIFMLGLPGLLIGPVMMNIFVRTAPLLLAHIQSEPKSTDK